MTWKPLDVTDEEIKAAVRAFSKKCRFLVDENLDSETAPFLRGEGWNVKTVEEARLRGHSDEDVLALAHREDRVLLTHDSDYLDDRRFPAHRNPGIVILPGATGDVRALVRALMDLMAIAAPYREFVRSAKVVFRADGSVAITARSFNTGRMETSLYRLPPGRPVEEWQEP
jgi:predicted nuclease of predicted toxin-antitoxin system